MATANTVRKTSTQASRFSIRASASQKRVIAEAAHIQDKTISDFMLDQSLTAAQRVIADQVQFRLSKKQWKQFCDALDCLRIRSKPCGCNRVWLMWVIELVWSRLPELNRRPSNYESDQSKKSK